MAMQILYPTWHNHEHIGLVLEIDEVAKAFARHDLSDKLPWFGSKLEHSEGDELHGELYSDEVTCTTSSGDSRHVVAPSTSADLGKPLKAKNLLGDTGSALHAVSRRTVRKHKHLIRKA